MLHSIHFQQQPRQHSSLPQKIVRNLASFVDCHPGQAHQIYDLLMARSFIEKHFDQSVLKAFDSLRPMAYKADLFRYCLLYEMGGMYADLSLYFFSPVNQADQNTKLTVFREVSNRAPWILSNSLILAAPGMPVFAACIDRIVEHVDKDYYGVNALCPTGPNLFGAQLACTTDLADLVSGEVVRISRNGGHSYAYLLPDGEVAAVAVKRGAGLGSLGAATAENYNDFYDNRSIYKHNASVRKWTFPELPKQAAMVTTSGKRRFMSGIIIFGPYVSLNRGHYRASFILSKEDLEALKQADFKIDACTNFGQQPIVTADLAVESRQAGLYAVNTTFVLEQPAENIEVRLHIAKAGTLAIERLEIASQNQAS